MKKLRWSEQASNNLSDIYSFIARDSEYYARVFVNHLLDFIETIPKLPSAGRIVLEYKDPSAGSGYIAITV